MIAGARIQQARELRGLTQVTLASRTTVSQSTIARLEAGEIQPSEALLQSIAIQTGFVPSFFRQPPSEHFPYGSLQFRARSDVTAKERQQAYQYARTVFEVVDMLLSRLEVESPRIAVADLEPTTAATQIRSDLGLSADTPIQDLTYSIERAGVIVVALPIALRGRDGFSGWAGHPQLWPVINVSVGVPGDRLRWTLAHELGELVLPPATRPPEREKAANQFAAELLLPSSAMLRELRPPITLLSAARLKGRWHVSMQAIISRASELQIISERQRRYLFAQLTTKGWRQQEPENLHVEPEQPQGLKRMVQLLYGDPPDIRKLALDSNLSIKFLTDLLAAQGMATEQSGSVDMIVRSLREATD